MAEVEEKDGLSSTQRLDGASKKESKKNVANTSPQSNASWLVGDVVWSKIPGHPWWPSMVAYEPNNAVYFQFKGRARYYHVQFFGQDPVRGWVAERSVIKFEGREKFETSVHGKQHKVNPKRLALWETAVKVAERAIPMNRHERQLCFTFKYYDKKERKRRGSKSKNTSEGDTPSFEDVTGKAELKPCSVSGISETSSGASDRDSEASGHTRVEGLISKGVKRKRVRKQHADGTPIELPVVNQKSKQETCEEPPKKKKTAKKVDMVNTKESLVLDLEPPSVGHVNGNVSPPRFNGDASNFPVNGELSPGSALKLKIRKIKQSEEVAHIKRKRGRPPKVKETFVIVNEAVSESPKSDLEEVSSGDKLLGFTEVVTSEQKPTTTFRPSSPPEPVSSSTTEKPKKRKKKLESEFAAVGSTRECDNSSEANAVVSEKSEPPVEDSGGVEVQSTTNSSVTASNNDDDASSSRGGSAVKKERDAVCVVCEQIDDLIFCEGVCGNAYHPDCIGLSGPPKGKFMCDECTTGNHSCFVCRQTGEVKRCNQSMCTKFYHESCLKELKTAKFEGEKMFCPLHSCSVCVANNRNTFRGKLVRCVRCPTAYHQTGCVVAGCIPVTSQTMVCAKHFWPTKSKAHHSHVNVNWCFVCSVGGTLICCESCPAAFHPECISYEGIPEGHFFCKDCTEGKSLLYGDIVWVKLGLYRWWPAQICNPRDVPTNIQNMRHQPGEFPVQFLGSHDYYWIHKGRVFNYQEGDKGSSDAGSKHLAKLFKRALLEAKEKYDEWKKVQESKAELDLQKLNKKLSKKPPPYKHVKCNKYTTAQRFVMDADELPVCECSADSENPCGPDSNCLNRMLQFECNPSKCLAKEKCQNQRFQKREYVDCEPFKTPGRGWGLRVNKDYKRGSFVIEYVGELIDEATCRERVKKGDDDTNYYMLTVDKDCIIDAGPMGNYSRFMNHSCDPNCETQKWTVNGEVRIGLFASQDIKAGEEVTFNYRLDSFGNEKKKCNCESVNCSGFLGIRPKTQNAQLQENKIKKAAERKKKRKPKKVVVKEVHEDDCFICGDGGELVMCDKLGCAKCYHLECLKIEEKLRGKWMCPWHFCDECGKKATVLCSECPNSFCGAHAEGQITSVGPEQYFCGDHIITRKKIPPSNHQEPVRTEPVQKDLLREPSTELE